MTETRKFQPAFLLRALAENAGKTAPAKETQDLFTFYDLREQPAMNSEERDVEDLSGEDSDKV